MTPSLFAAADAMPEPLQKQNLAELVRLVEVFLQAKASASSRPVQVTVFPPDDRLELASCAAPEVFLPQGGHLQGRVTVGVRCKAPVSWTLYVQANVGVMMEYLVTALPLAAGHVIGYNDLTTVTAEQSPVTAYYVTDPSQLVGRTLAMTMAAGTPFRLNALRKNDVVKQGQTVRVMSARQGFRISTSGVAQSGGVEGDTVSVKLKSGKIVAGTAHEGGTVELSQ
ncbi:flagellar basal body P-ring formation chaperone FlgA [Candidatus Methylospira mobilis]|nr:flagellar basal body P-ring formation chaperone FlgA [Candidatus Methylospira mobilis]